MQPFLYDSPRTWTTQAPPLYVRTWLRLTISSHWIFLRIYQIDIRVGCGTLSISGVSDTLVYLESFPPALAERIPGGCVVCQWGFGTECSSSHHLMNLCSLQHVAAVLFHSSGVFHPSPVFIFRRNKTDRNILSRLHMWFWGFLYYRKWPNSTSGAVKCEENSFKIWLKRQKMKI